MYSLRSEFNTFDIPIQRHEHNVNLLTNLKSYLPEIMFLSSESTKLSQIHSSYFTIEELESLFYGLPYSTITPADSALKSPEPDLRAKKLATLHKINRKLQKRIQVILSFIKEHSGRSSLDTSPPSNILRLPKILINKPICKRVTDEEVRLRLESEKITLLEKLQTWSWYSMSHREVVESLEEYKKLVAKYIRRSFRKGDAGISFWNTLRTLRSNSLNEELAIDNPRNRRHRQSEGKGKIVRKTKKRNKSKNIWTQLNLYFLNLGTDIDTVFDHLYSSSQKEQLDVQFLNMPVVNRLAAIAKMLQYCTDNGMTVKDFMNGRTYQKIRAHLKQIEEPEHEGEISICPSLDEIPYLQSIGNDNLLSVTESLKSTVTSTMSGGYMKRYEELKELEERNRNIISKIREKIAEEDKSTTLLEIPSILIGSKRQYKRGKKRNSRLKRFKAEDSSDTSANSKGDPSKTVLPEGQKVGTIKFKIYKAIPSVGLDSREVKSD